MKATFTDICREDKGSIIRLSKVCEQYIIDVMDWKADIIGLERVETLEIPVEASREAVINSYGHSLWKAFHKRKMAVSYDILWELLIDKK